MSTAESSRTTATESQLSASQSQRKAEVITIAPPCSSVACSSLGTVTPGRVIAVHGSDVGSVSIPLDLKEERERRANLIANKGVESVSTSKDA